LKRRDQNYQRISEVLNSQPKENLLVALEALVQAYKEETIKKENPGVPFSLFGHRKLGVLEILVKCLKESFSMSYSKIARILNRDDRTIWATYNNSRHKYKDKFFLKEEQYIIPCNIFFNRRLGPLEALTVYAHDDLHLHFAEISKLLNRNYRTIWLSYSNGVKKIGENE
jgi:hypothetical protein